MSLAEEYERGLREGAAIGVEHAARLADRLGEVHSDVLRRHAASIRAGRMEVPR